VYVCATLVSAGTRFPGRNIKRKVTEFVYLACAFVRPTQSVATEVCTFDMVTNIINRANFGGCVLRGLVSIYEEPNLGFSHRKLL
jgi:hypothetical protein